MDELTHKLEQLPIDELVTSAVQALEGINALVQRPELAAALGDAGQVMAGVKTALSQIRPHLAGAAAAMRSALAEHASGARKGEMEVAPIYTNERASWRERVSIEV